MTISEGRRLAGLHPQGAVGGFIEPRDLATLILREKGLRDRAGDCAGNIIEFGSGAPIARYCFQAVRL